MNVEDPFSSSRPVLIHTGSFLDQSAPVFFEEHDIIAVSHHYMSPMALHTHLTRFIPFFDRAFVRFSWEEEEQKIMLEPTDDPVPDLEGTNFFSRFSSMSDPQPTRQVSVDLLVNHPHNIYRDVLSELGIECGVLLVRDLVAEGTESTDTPRRQMVVLTGNPIWRDFSTTASTSTSSITEVAPVLSDWLRRAVSWSFTSTDLQIPEFVSALSTTHAPTHVFDCTGREATYSFEDRKRLTHSNKTPIVWHWPVLETRNYSWEFPSIYPWVVVLRSALPFGSEAGEEVYLNRLARAGFLVINATSSADEVSLMYTNAVRTQLMSSPKVALPVSTGPDVPVQSVQLERHFLREELGGSSYQAPGKSWTVRRSGSGVAFFDVLSLSGNHEVPTIKSIGGGVEGQASELLKEIAIASELVGLCIDTDSLRIVYGGRQLSHDGLGSMTIANVMSADAVTVKASISVEPVVELAKRIFEVEYY